MGANPRIGDIVLYRTDGRNGLDYALPAIVTVTQDTHPGDYPDGRSNALPVPKDETTVHLTVFTPGGVGAALVDENDETVESPDSVQWIGGKAIDTTKASGTYVELNVPFGTGPRTWRFR